MSKMFMHTTVYATSPSFSMIPRLCTTTGSTSASLKSFTEIISVLPLEMELVSPVSRISKSLTAHT